MSAPGAVIVVGGPAEGRGEAARRAARAFAGRADGLLRWSEGPLAIALLEGPERELHVGGETVCLVEGPLYEVGGAPADQTGATTAAGLLARAYEEHGEAVLPGLRGEFWALLWSRSRRQGVVLADQIGSRAPYWSYERGAVLVASEVPELLACLDRRPAPDPLAIAHWLMMTGPRAGTTLFAGVAPLRSGHLLRISAGGARPERYWSPAYRGPLGGPREEQVDRLRAALARAVGRRCPKGARAGVLLSGGLDSSTVAALASERGEPRAYSAVFPDHPAMDESALVERTTARLGIDSTRIVIRSGATLAGALDYMDTWKLPPTSPNLFFWVPLLRRAAEDGVEVMLDGEGGDELFTFSPYLVADRLRRGRLAGALDLCRRWAGESAPPSRELLLLRLRLAGARALVPPVAHRLARRLRAVERQAPPWLAPPLARRWIASEDSAFAWKELSGPRWRAYLVDLVTRGAGPSVVYEQARRRARMAGISARHPLVDVDVVEVMLSLDPELGFDRRYDRAVLRDAIAGLVPEEVRLRRGKSNFDALFHQLLAGPELPAVRQLLDPRRAHLGEYVDAAEMHRSLLAGGPPPGGRERARWAVQVWRAVTAECWLRAQADPAALARLRERQLPSLSATFETSTAADIRLSRLARG